MITRKKIHWGQVVPLTILTTVAILVIAPYIWMLLTTFKSTPEIRQNPGKILPINWTLSGYHYVLTESPFLRWFINSVIVSVTVTVAVVFTSTLVGFVFSKYQFRFKKVLFWFILATMMVPYQITMIPQFLIIVELNLYDSLWALIVPALVSAFGVYLCRSFCDDIPDSLCEAAIIDGAGPFRIYWTVILPLLKPCIGALSIFIFLEVWNEYLKPLIMLSQVNKMTLPLALSYFSTARIHDIGSIMSASSLIMLPATILLLVFQKQFIKGVAMTGMK
ncbi:MAG: carbohydrate ABC transporter permease [Propionibacteriaceae bacterium]|jgi:ABC-type glycerol-3-phosphate transport system permease component|nr:carbohydrate ABC transporter permease [Propionibacteriaceae bacterium]